MDRKAAVILLLFLWTAANGGAAENDLHVFRNGELNIFSFLAQDHPGIFSFQYPVGNNSRLRVIGDDEGLIIGCKTARAAAAAIRLATPGALKVQVTGGFGIPYPEIKGVVIDHAFAEDAVTGIIEMDVVTSCTGRQYTAVGGVDQAIIKIYAMLRTKPKQDGVFDVRQLFPDIRGIVGCVGTGLRGSDQAAVTCVRGCIKNDLQARHDFFYAVGIITARWVVNDNQSV